MPRKRKAQLNLRGVSPNSPEYWDEILQREGLQMAAGRHEDLSYVGSASNVDYINDAVSTRQGRVAPKRPSD